MEDIRLRMTQCWKCQSQDGIVARDIHLYKISRWKIFSPTGYCGDKYSSQCSDQYDTLVGGMQLNEVCWEILSSIRVCLLVGCCTSQQHASVSQGRICSDNFTCCHTQIEVADQTFHLTRSQYTDTGPPSPSADPIMRGAWQGSHWSANF